MNEFLLIYIVIINIITFIVFALDKYLAIHNKYRIRVRTLFIFCILGGSIGGLISMYLFRHKTKQNSFRIGVPLILIIELMLILSLKFC